MTNKEHYKRLISHCMSPGIHSFCNDLIKPYYLRDPKAKCASWNEDGSFTVRNCDECKKGFSKWLDQEYKPEEDPHYLDAYV